MSDSFKLLEQHVLNAYGDNLRARVDSYRASHHMINMLNSNWSYLFCSLIFYVPWYLLVWIIGFISKPLKVRLSGPFLKRFLTSYYHNKGCIPYFVSTAEKPPEKADRPRLVFTIRYGHMSSLFAYHKFSFPVVVPVSPGFDAFVPSSKLPLKIGKLFKHISYPDTSLPYDLDNIKTLLKAGHTVIVHINVGVVNPSHNHLLYIHESFYDLLDLDVESYFLNMGNMDQYPFSNRHNKVLMPMELVPKDDVIFDIETSNREMINDFVGGFFEHFDVMIANTPDSLKTES